MKEAPHEHRLGAKADSPDAFGVAVLTVSTGVAAGEHPDGGSPPIVDAVQGWGIRVEHQDVVPDDVDVISAALRSWAADPRVDLILTTGGTGLSPTDVTPEATQEVCERHAPGIAEYLRLNLFRPTGIGMLIGGALMGIVLALPLVVSAIRSMRDAAKSRSELSQDELPIQMLYMGVAAAFVVLAIIAWTAVAEVGLGRGLTMALLGTLWIWVAGVVLSECIGRTNWSPLSGMTLIGVTIMILVTSGIGDRASIIASVTVGAAMCVAMAQATDLMLDLKTGYLVGAIPKQQQKAQFLGTWIGPIIIMALIVVLHQAYTLGSDQLPAPQGQALASVIQGILGGDVPRDKYLTGAGLGALLSASGIGGLGVLVGLGFYLPFHIVLTYTIGTLLRVISDWKLGKLWSEDVGVPIAAGLIVGEAMIGVIYSLYIVFG